MSIKISELLDTRRLRPLWQRGGAPSRPEGGADKDAAPEQGEPAEPAEPTEPLGPPRLALEPPHVVLEELEEALRANLGPRSLLVVHLVHPLRAAVRRIDASAPAGGGHPLEQAASGDVFALIDKLDDALGGILRSEK